MLKYPSYYRRCFYTDFKLSAEMLIYTMYIVPPTYVYIYTVFLFYFILFI